MTGHKLPVILVSILLVLTGVVIVSVLVVLSKYTHLYICLHNKY